MSFSDEVDAARNAMTSKDTQRREREAREHEVRAQLSSQFDSELKALWHSAEDYWLANSKRIDAQSSTYITTGKWNGDPDTMVAFPLLAFRVSKEPRSRSREDWEAGTVTPSESVTGFKVGGWFALCAPGELRELQDKYGMGGYPARAMRIEQSYFRIPAAEEPPQSSEDEVPTFRVEFAGPPGNPDVILSCGLQRPIVVHTRSGDRSESVGTLRQLVAATVAEAMAHAENPNPTS
jgi:hypothetical protein